MKKKMQLPPSPFTMSPNPLCIYLTPSFMSVLNKVRFVTSRKQGMTAIIGDVGLGKSSLLRLIEMEYSNMEDMLTISLPTSEYKSSFAFLKAICTEVEIAPKRSQYDQVLAFQEFLIQRYDEGKTVLLCVDEAQKLDNSMLELCRAFLNFETYEEKLLQIVLAGQLELSETLQMQKNKALYSRVFLPSFLAPLTPEEARNVIEHRCKYYEIDNPFPTETIEFLYTNSNGVPRTLLMTCAETYDIMLSQRSRQVTVEMVKSVLGTSR